MTPADLQQLLRDCYMERVTLLMRHEGVAQHVTDYDINNAYQYIISREETHLSWLQQALVGMGAPLPADPARPAVPSPGKGDAWQRLAADDARANAAFVEAWQPKVEQVTHARHRGMLRVMLGEMLEHKRLFDQAGAGRTDLIGTALPINERRGIVLGTRWIE